MPTNGGTNVGSGRRWFSWLMALTLAVWCGPLRSAPNSHSRGIGPRRLPIVHNTRRRVLSALYLQLAASHVGVVQPFGLAPPCRPEPSTTDNTGGPLILRDTLSLRGFKNLELLLYFGSHSWSSVTLNRHRRRRCTFRGWGGRFGGKSPDALLDPMNGGARTAPTAQDAGGTDGSSAPTHTPRKVLWRSTSRHNRKDLQYRNDVYNTHKNPTMTHIRSDSTDRVLASPPRSHSFTGPLDHPVEEFFHVTRRNGFRVPNARNTFFHIRSSSRLVHTGLPDCKGEAMVWHQPLPSECWCSAPRSAPTRAPRRRGGPVSRPLMSLSWLRI